MVNLTALQENQPAGLFPTIHTVGQSAQFRTDNQSTLPLKWKWYVQDQCSSWYIINQKEQICQTFNYQMNEMLLVLPETNHPEIFQVWNIKCRENFVCTENLTISSVHYWNLNTVKILFTISRPHTFCVQEWSSSMLL